MSVLTIHARNQAIEQLAREHDVKLRRFVMKHSYNKECVDDIVQSTYIEAIKKPPPVRGQSLLKLGFLASHTTLLETTIARIIRKQAMSH